MKTQVKTRKNLSATEARNLRTLLLLSVFEPQDIGARIAAARKQAGLTQEELGDLIGLSTRSVQGYEAGDVPPYKHLDKISEVVRRSVGWLLHGETEIEGASNDRLERIETQLAEIRGMLAGEVRASDVPAQAQDSPAVRKAPGR